MDWQKAKIIFLGTPNFGVPILFNLIKSHYNIIAVISQPDRPVGRQQIIEVTPVKKVALENKILVEQFESLRTANAVNFIKKNEPDLLVVVAYGQIIPQTILDIPKYGCLNIHPSLLPKYRGASPVAAAILNGDQETGVTIIKLDDKIDHGSIVSQSVFTILEDDNTESLENSLACEGAELLAKVLPDYLADKIIAQPQDDSLATYTKILTKNDGQIDWQKTPLEIDCQIRALYPWPGTWTTHHGKNIKIIRAHIEAQKLKIDLMQPAGKLPMSYKEFVNGYGQLESDKVLNNSK
ncbi:MAG: methionyl-tRNA formyltransferase [Patescibacteria group bacterium]